MVSRDLVPARERRRERALAGEADRAIDRHPAHHARVEELLPPAAHLPDALVGLAPVLAHPVDQPDDVHPRVVRDRRAVLVVQVHRVHQLAVDVELEVRVGGVADAHRARAHVALEVRQRLLGQLVAAVDAVHDLQRAVGLRAPAQRAIIQRMNAAASSRVAEPHEAVEREGRVADPRVAVVPVAHAADVLGQPERRRGDDRAVLAAT